MSENVLFTPIQIGNTVLKNRIFMSALTRNRAENTYPTELMKKYYVQRASAGLIISEGVLISRQGSEWPHAPGIWSNEHIVAWKNIVDGVHEAGGKIYIQLWHIGCIAHPEAPEQILANVPVYAPSAISARGGKFRHIPGVPGYVTPTEVEDPRTLIQLYKDAAVKAKAAGFDGAELVGNGGYLGGSIENRGRFGLEVLKVLINVFGRDVAIKIQPSGGYNDVGMPLQETLDTYSYFISEANKLNLSFIELMRYSPKFDIEYNGVHRATKHDVLKSYRPYIKNSKLIINTGVTPEEGEALVSAGKVDSISMALNYITHSDVVERVLHDKPLDNVPNIPHFYPNKDSANHNWSIGYTDYPLATY